jgi:putative membrane protein
MGALWSAIVALVVAAVVLMIVSRFNLGLSVSGFGAAIISALVIAIVGAIVLWLLGLMGLSIGGGVLGLLVYLVVAAVVLLIAGRFVPGLSVSGFMGAFVAAIAIAVVYWILVYLLGLIGITI